MSTEAWFHESSTTGPRCLFTIREKGEAFSCGRPARTPTSERDGYPACGRHCSENRKKRAANKRRRRIEEAREDRWYDR